MDFAADVNVTESAMDVHGPLIKSISEELDMCLV